MFWGVFRKLNILGDMKILWIFLGSSQNWTIFRGHFYAFGSFLKVKVQNRGYFWGCKISNILRVLEIPDDFWGERYILGPSLRMKKK